MESCDRCQKALPQGALRFAARLRLTGDTGGITQEEVSQSQPLLEDALKAAENLSEGELLETVVEEFHFTLCPACRAQLRSDPAGASTTRRAAGRAVQ
jgi:hypothetical protein